MTDVTLTYSDAEALWQQWATDPEDVLARAAFERTLRYAAGLEDEGLYFRPGGWVVNLPTTAARIALASAVLAAGFQVVGLDDLPREIIIAAAGLVSTMDIAPIRPTRQDDRIAQRLRDENLEEVALTPAQARKVLPRRLRAEVSEDQIVAALDRLVAAGLADREGNEFVLRSQGREAWIRHSLHKPD